MFRSFLDSPSKRIGTGAGPDDVYENIISDFHIQSMTSQMSDDSPDGQGVPSSPPASLFYMYDSGHKFDKYWGSDPGSADNGAQAHNDTAEPSTGDNVTPKSQG